ncbi:GNAT family N-acetyltransferase/peptidase C39 family protein [Catenovulum sediminis]|uniref:GNAT family N-acetyltransferase/peptidase C39 family protein n=1 Tax=Catenovulum sediminis TaxID=1740262 RepID=A0ABV1RKT2_9ALTE|nr:GNAT family N-acetyltransferase/peptidase C39 family protein [Catenovulum sediminis]
MSIQLRRAVADDLNALVNLEAESFDGDRISRRRLKHWLNASNGIFYIAEQNGDILGYALTILYKGSCLARLYSIATRPQARGMGLASRLIEECEASAYRKGRLYMRLEVAENNKNAIRLYQKLGYEEFGYYSDYYHDHQNAVRMQKRLRYEPIKLTTSPVAWYQQTTSFTCGPAAAMMAMNAVNAHYQPTQSDELQIWREATTIYMTSGHGGCHPLGLAIAMTRRGFQCEAFISVADTLFAEGVRSEHKRQILDCVEQDFKKQAEQLSIVVHNKAYHQQDIQTWLNDGKMILLLISTYRLDGQKAPHWVTVSGIDENCIYIHDPDPAQEEDNQLNCQYLPIERNNFAKMAKYGKNKLACAILVAK